MHKTICIGAASDKLYAWSCAALTNGKKIEVKTLRRKRFDTMSITMHQNVRKQTITM